VSEAALPPDQRLPPPVVDLAIDGIFRLPPSRDTRREAVPITTIIAALLLHVLVLALLLSSWRSPQAPVKSLQVQLLREAPKPPSPPPKKAEQPKPPPEKPKPKVEEKPKPPPPPKPPTMKPRESGADQKTEAAKSEKPKEELPKAMPIQPQAAALPPPPEPMPLPPEPKPTPPRTRAKETALGKGKAVPLEALPSALQPERQTRPPVRNLVLRLPGPGGGTGDRDYVGDAYLNHLRSLLERNRVYPPAEAFSGTERPTAVFAVQIEPGGQIVTITLLGTTGVPKVDEGAREMITNSEPFPHLPPDYPQMRTVITVFLPMFPAR
jgi:periplasmic protein TonB